MPPHRGRAIQPSARSAAKSPASRPWRIDYLEREHRFRAAATGAAALVGRRVAVQPGLYPIVRSTLTPETDPIVREDLAGPISLSTGELTPVMLLVGPAPGGASATLSDLSFIPAFRPMTGCSAR